MSPASDWIGSMISAVIDESLRTGAVRMDDATLAVMNELRDFMFANVYQSAEQQRQQRRAIAVIRDLMDWHLEHPEEIPDSYRQHRCTAGRAGGRLHRRHDRPVRAGHPRPALPPDAQPLAEDPQRLRAAPPASTGVRPMLVPSACAGSARRTPSMVTRFPV